MVTTVCTFRRVAGIMKRELPETFAVVEKVETGLGDLPVAKKRGEGGSTDLVRRLADCFYNKFNRYTVHSF